MSLYIRAYTKKRAHIWAFVYVSKNIICSLKIQNNYGAIQLFIFQYLFIAPCQFIALIFFATVLASWRQQQ